MASSYNDKKNIDKSRLANKTLRVVTVYVSTRKQFATVYELVYVSTRKHSLLFMN